jgi:hypothetical protein
MYRRYLSQAVPFAGWAFWYVPNFSARYLVDEDSAKKYFPPKCLALPAFRYLSTELQLDRNRLVQCIPKETFDSA